MQAAKKYQSDRKNGDYGGCAYHPPAEYKSELFFLMQTWTRDAGQEFNYRLSMVKTGIKWLCQFSLILLLIGSTFASKNSFLRNWHFSAKINNLINSCLCSLTETFSFFCEWKRSFRIICHSCETIWKRFNNKCWICRVLYKILSHPFCSSPWG